MVITEREKWSEISLIAGFWESKIVQELAKSGDAKPSSMYGKWVVFLEEENLSNKDLIYFPTTVTSSGFANEYDLQNRDQNKGKIIGDNLQLSRDLIEILKNKDQVPAGKKFLLPSDLGKVEGWEELNYMIFWIMVISGIPKGNAEEFEEMAKRAFSEEEFSDYNGDQNERWENQYNPFVEKVVGHLESLDDLNNVSSVVGLACTHSFEDYLPSHGTRAERMIAERLGIRSGVVVTDDLQNPELDDVKFPKLIPRGAVLQTAVQPSVEDGGNSKGLHIQWNS